MRNTSVAQLVPDFTPNKTSGCSPLAVSLVNTTTGASAGATYIWNFGNGNGISTTDKNTPVAATYFAGQDYTVSLTVKDGAQSLTKTAVITVYKSPVIDFSIANAIGCSPLTTSFAAIANPGDGTVTGYFWDFGDGKTLSTSSATVSNTYLFPGTYSVSLTVTNSFGCSNTLKKIDIVTVYPALAPSFSVDSATVCSLNHPLLFNNTSTGTGPLTYSWNFGDGGNSTSQNPSYQYSGKGIYNVQLTVTNAVGCTATLTKPAYINAANYTPDFSSSSALCAGNTILFNNNSSPSPTGDVFWDFGDGGSGIGLNMTHAYAVAGNYAVTVSQNFGTCPVSFTKTIPVSAPPVVGPFLVSKGIACQSPMLVSFADTTSAAVAWLWDFTGNPSDTSSSQNPSFLYSGNGIYTPSVKVTNASGCSTTFSEALNSAQPTATIHVDTTLTQSSVFCADVNATFSAISQDTISVFNWSFGDGTSSTSPNPSHTYTLPGTYIINLSFTTNHGCTGTAFPPDTVIVYPKPHAIFTALDSMPCATNQLEIFTNLDDSAARFNWIYGDGNSDIDNNIVHTHQYGAAGSYNMTLIASSPGCKNDTSTITRYVKTTPIPAATVSNNCDSDRLTVAIADTAPGATEYIWNYGDGSPNDTNYVYVPSRNHHYPQNGAYTASITAVFGACTQNSGPVPVFVLPKQQPVLSSLKDTICGSSSLPVVISGLDTNYQRLSIGSNLYYHIVNWQYNDGTLIPPKGNTAFKNSYSGSLYALLQGKDSIRVIIQSNYFNCFDTSNYIPIHINGPVAAFGAMDKICYRNPVVFTDSSKATDGIPLVQWVWNFGDGNSETRNTGDTVMHTYAFPGTYKPSLTVTDSIGCSATVKLAVTQIIIYGSKADFNWKPVNIAPGFPVTFYNSSITNSGAIFQWHFYSDGSNSTNPDSVVHTFSNIGLDTVSLVASATTAGTCADTSIQYVVVKNIIARFTYTTQYIDHANCPPMVAYFKSNTYNTIGLHWDFGDGATADNNPDPSHTYNLPGTYVITLTGYGANGISTTYQDSLTVKGPFGTLYSSLLQACIPAVDTLHATASYAGSFTWDFGDGTVMTTSDTLAVHTYILPGLFTPALILTDSTGCQITFRYNRQLLMDTLHVSLGAPVQRCDTGSVAFDPKVLSFVADSLNYPLTYHWDFGSGNPADSSNQSNPVFDYHSPGNYLTQLQVQSPIGCVSGAIDSVFIVPRFLIQPPKDMTICIGGSATLKAAGAFSYEWSPSASLNQNQGDSVVAHPDATTLYNVVGTDKYHCFLDTGKLTVFVDTLPAVILPPDMAVLPGTSVVIDSKVSSDVISWNWAPPLYLSCTDCSAPTSIPQDPVTYTLTVTTAAGCKASSSVTIRILCSDKGVYMANAFSPNFDGNNDYFYPAGNGIKLVKSFQVYSRWGQLLYSKTDFPPNDKTFGWNGTLNGTPQPAGTYVYVSSMECFSGESFILKGTVELLR
ncbi:MAG: PKD domain-containing protein [Bacteroidota bacterium]|nr:PKD domain-containing protein [Bacteroidota bacterium]